MYQTLRGKSKLKALFLWGGKIVSHRDAVCELKMAIESHVCFLGKAPQEKHPRQLMRNRLVEKAVESFLDSELQKKSKNICRHHDLELTLCKSKFKIIMTHNFWRAWGVCNQFHLRLFGA